MCIFVNEGGPKSKSSRKETPLKIQKYKEKHVSGKNLEKMFSAPTPILQATNPYHSSRVKPPSEFYIPVDPQLVGQILSETTPKEGIKNSQ